MRSYWTYILASKPRGTLYIGVTNGLIFASSSTAPAKAQPSPASTGCDMLVWYEEFAASATRSSARRR